MTMPSYLLGWAAESEVPGIAPPSGYAWNVNLDDGSSNRNDQGYHNHVRAVRAGECRNAMSFRSLYSAWRDARGGKKPSADQMAFDLSSQFFANVYLDRLDQFVKHRLRTSRYLRYVDDFVLVHHDRAQLEAWLAQITEFLRTELRLELKPAKLARLTAGIDFLGYFIKPTHTTVRRRVIAHCRAKLAEFERRGDTSLEARERLRSVVSSYWGHFRHAKHWRLCRRLHARFPWLANALAGNADERRGKT